jgi:hypothetical protein
MDEDPSEAWRDNDRKYEKTKKILWTAQHGIKYVLHATTFYNVDKNSIASCQKLAKE